MSVTRAKFRCTGVEHSGLCATEPGTQPAAPRTYRFSAEYDTTVPEDQRYAKYTPAGQLNITVDNPAVAFTPGASYYLDFTPA